MCFSVCDRVTFDRLESQYPSMDIGRVRLRVVAMTVPDTYLSYHIGSSSRRDFLLGWRKQEHY